MFGNRAAGEGRVSDAKSVVQSAAKIFAVLRAFSADRPELTITEVAGLAALDRGTSFRLINTLVALGYLAPVPDSRRFRLALKCLELGHSALAAGGLTAMARPLLRELVPGIADAASLGMLEGPDVVYIARSQADMGRRDLDRRVGSRTGAYAAALGHALLAWRPEPEARAVLEASDRVKVSDRTLTDLDQLMTRLRQVRARGYATADGENAYGLRTIAAPVFDAAGAPHAGVSLTVRSERCPLDAFVEAALPSLRRVTEALSQAMMHTAIDRRAG